ncbi:DNA-binding protein [Mycolicibacter heraklionensis]|uniref:DNA-binding protein n=1 Tax=Mycolicibacter heraklionensis TaxID=512402 RepID=A0ABR5FFB1_9MYCO|nr:OB-fold domain-containing protein [Mycolicibacter heraklionensis]KLO28765.1 DNA-binding protein [Mycolicibacter heraklionensis]
MQKALAPDISTWPDPDPHLIGSRCSDCGATAFPAQSRCPKCSSAQVTEILLPRSGVLVAWTTQGFPPGPPFAGPTGEAFTPFGIGLVQLDDVIRVEARLTENDPAKLRFGMKVVLTMLPLATDDADDEILTFAFQPVEPDLPDRSSQG